MDTKEGDDTDPLSLHKYLYTKANPVDGIDPSGNDDISDTLDAVTMSIMPSAMLSLAGITGPHVEVHFDRLGSLMGKSWHHSYLLLKESGQPTYLFRGGPSAQDCGFSDLPGTNTAEDCGYVTSSGSGGVFGPGSKDYPNSSNSDVAMMNVPAFGQSFGALYGDFEADATKIDNLRIPYTPLGQNSNAFAYTLLLKNNLIPPSPPVWAPGWGVSLF
jgi:hypothetical protein